MSLKRRVSTRSSTRRSISGAKPEPISEKAEQSPLDCTLSDVTCPICLEICVEPVTMPCTHELCLPCFKSMTDLTNFLCPMCRQRISTWSRNAANSNTLVNQDRWAFIQKHFAKEIKNRLEGKTAQIIANEIDEHKRALVSASDQSHSCSKPGEIRKEYQEYLLREQERIRLEKEKEEKQSLELIQKLIQEEERLSINDYIDIINNTPVVQRSSQVQPFRPLTNTNPINRQINNLNSHLMQRVNSMEQNSTPIQSSTLISTENSVAVSSRGRPKLKRKHRNSARSSNQSVDSQTQDEANSRPTRSRQTELASETSNSSLRQSDVSSLNDTNEVSSSVSEENGSFVTRRLRPRRAKV